MSPPNPAFHEPRPGSSPHHSPSPQRRGETTGPPATRAKSFWPLAILLLCAVILAYGLLELFELRYQTGDVYPPYSSLRADPLGTMILYESLSSLPGVSVSRDISAQNQLPDGQDTTYLHLAARREDWQLIPQELLPELEGFLVRGGRLVIAFYPELSPPFSFTPPPGSPGAKPGSGPGADATRPRVSLQKKWGIQLGYVPLPHGSGEAYSPVTVRKASPLPLPESLDWHSGMVFTNLAPDWQVVYARGTNPVLVERKFGPGTVVLCSDSYFLSNEAMTRARHAELLAWVLGPARRVFFDEAHLGIVERPGVATLMRRDRLHGLVAGLLLLVALFIWKSSASFVPLYPETLAPDAVRGRDAGAGFINLLRRNIAPPDVLQTCFNEWIKSFAKGSGIALARVDRAQAILEEENGRARTERNPVRAYREICHALKAPAKLQKH
jgi:Domain of unknown function (DUF4350)